MGGRISWEWLRAFGILNPPQPGWPWIGLRPFPDLGPCPKSRGGAWVELGISFLAPIPPFPAPIPPFLHSQPSFPHSYIPSSHSHNSSSHSQVPFPHSQLPSPHSYIPSPHFRIPSSNSHIPSFPAHIPAFPAPIPSSPSHSQVFRECCHPGSLGKGRSERSAPARTPLDPPGNAEIPPGTNLGINNRPGSQEFQRLPLRAQLPSRIPAGFTWERLLCPRSGIWDHSRRGERGSPG